ncbi:MAG: hypothetical protein J5732_01710 [Bacteroidaceae bacterium]|nr:hypothetical protein [Bacteroidaceae bacterium]
MFLTKLSHKGKDINYNDLLVMPSNQTGISKKIFQIYLTTNCKAKLSQRLVDNIEKIKSLNPEWEYNLFTYKNVKPFILQNYGKIVYSYFSRINPKYGAARADFLRYLLIYHYGGVYLDLKCTFTKPLSDSLLTSDAFVLPIWGEHGERGERDRSVIPSDITRELLLNPVIISSPGHPFIYRLLVNIMKKIDSYNPYTDGVGWNGVHEVTGPWIYSRSIYECIDKNNGLFRRDDIHQSLGYCLSIYKNKENNEYGGVGLHAETKMTDYRRNVEPVVKNDNQVLEMVNRIYLHILFKYRKMK